MSLRAGPPGRRGFHLRSDRRSFLTNRGRGDGGGLGAPFAGQTVDGFAHIDADQTGETDELALVDLVALDVALAGGAVGVLAGDALATAVAHPAPTARRVIGHRLAAGPLVLGVELGALGNPLFAQHLVGAGLRFAVFIELGAQGLHFLHGLKLGFGQPTLAFQAIQLG